MNEFGARDRFIGVWRLLRCERKLRDGSVDYPYGEAPVGRITYDAAGRISVQLMRPGRRSSGPSGISLVAANASDAEIREAVGGYLAYFGTFDVEESNVIHHIQACLVPSWVGTDLIRSYRFESNRLTLTAITPDNVTELFWEREPE